MEATDAAGVEVASAAETVMDTKPDIIGLGGECWVAKQLQRMRSSPTHVFDWVATTPSMLADILEDDGAKLLDSTLYLAKNWTGAHIQHSWYEAFVMKNHHGPH